MLLHFEGCFTTHAALKRDNRRCEADLLAAESLSALAGLDRTAALHAVWIPVLFNQFHDISMAPPFMTVTATRTGGPSRHGQRPPG